MMKRMIVAIVVAVGIVMSPGVAQAKPVYKTKHFVCKFKSNGTVKCHKRFVVKSPGPFTSDPFTAF